jgi:alpha-galactosidase
MILIDRNIPILKNPQVFMDENKFKNELKLLSSDSGIDEYLFEIKADFPSQVPEILIQWRMSSTNMKGQWTPNADHEKRLMSDWQVPRLESRTAVDSPVLCVFGHNDSNVVTFACDDAIHTVEMHAGIREENGSLYCQFKFFIDESPLLQNYSVRLLIIKQEVHFSEALKTVQQWWSQNPKYLPAKVPEAAKLPVYSTWYSYHQNFTLDNLRNECREALKLGYKVLIVDDGWETNDGNRGYDYTGDWEAVRIPETRKFVEEIQHMGMKVMFWYSVPFCGKKSKAYRWFSGKFLTETHPWAPVFDPRFPDVRAYLVNRYVLALKEWNLDGFKLDFIDDFKPFHDTDLSFREGQDFISINEATNQLLEDIKNALLSINPDVLIEFRQKYIGPAVRTVGNMFRAFDCPYDSLTNRIRTTDIRLLAGNSAVHSDMLMWNYSDKVELAALQFLNVIFSVPQLSVRLEKITDEHKKMITFYTQYWLENRSVLIDGRFVPHGISSNYPVITSSSDIHIIYGFFESQTATLTNDFQKIDLINAKKDTLIVLKSELDLGNYAVEIFDCLGNVVQTTTKIIEKGILLFEVPNSGLVKLNKI